LLKEIDLWEVSPVSLAMNPMAQITAAKARLSAEGEYVPTEREFEMHMRDAGCSRKVAATLVAKLYGDHSTSGMLDEASIDPAALQAAEELAAKFAVGCLRKF
jgi:hypothetical protein